MSMPASSFSMKKNDVFNPVLFLHRDASAMKRPSTLAGHGGDGDLRGPAARSRAPAVSTGHGDEASGDEPAQGPSEPAIRRDSREFHGCAHVSLSRRAAESASARATAFYPVAIFFQTF